MTAHGFTAERRIIQICAIGTENTMQTQSGAFLYALCDDGTVWEKPMGCPWAQIESVPQDAAATGSRG